MPNQDGTASGSGWDLRGILRDLYEGFFLVDVLGKVVPGLVFVVIWASVLKGSTSAVVNDVHELSAWVWLFLGGVGWLAGFGLQGLGEIFWITTYFPKQPHVWAETAEAQIKKHYRERREAALKGRETDRRELERLTVIREACGNGGIALLLGVLLVVFAGFVENRTVLTLFPPLALGVGLVWMHFANAERAQWFREVVTEDEVEDDKGTG